MIDDRFLEILVCPETHQPLALAEADVVERLNAAAAAGKLENRGGQPVSDTLTGGLVRKDGQYLYPIYEEIPCLLIEESIAL